MEVHDLYLRVAESRVCCEIKEVLKKKLVVAVLSKEL